MTFNITKSTEEEDSVQKELNTNDAKTVGLPDPAAGMFRVSKTEMVWPGKYNEDGSLKEVPRVNLPFQVIETINESRATREAKKAPQNLSLFDLWEGKEGDSFEEGWKNKIIWGDNLLVMGSLLEKFAGKIDLIYIDPPFATGADFSFNAEIGEIDVEVTKEQSIIEEKAYRDTWGKDLDSYLSMLSSRLVLMSELLSQNGTIWVHLDDYAGHYVKVILDEIFGRGCKLNQIIWYYPDNFQGNVNRYADNHNFILVYAINNNIRLNRVKIKLDKPILRDKRVWDKELQKIVAARDEEGKIIYEEYTEKTADNVWTIGQSSVSKRRSYEYLGYPTQKPQELLRRVILSGTNEGDLIADFFCGSGTTCAVAEKLSRRWIGCDLSRWAIHVTRKRLLGMENCKPFEVLNLGKYERKYWMGVTFGDKKKGDQQIVIFQYIAFMLRLYSAEPLTGMHHVHGKKGRALIHIGAVDAPVTIDEVNACIEECLAVGQSELHVLGWEWEMGMTPYIVQEAKRRGVKLLLITIPREVMEQQAIDKGDIQFFEVAHLEVEIEKDKGRQIMVTLSDFAFPYADMIPDDVRDKIKKWSDYIDYWAIDWNFQNDTFMNGWVAYRTRKERKLPLSSEPYTYDKPGAYTIMVKAVDIFGNDTSQTFDVEVK